MDQIICAVTQIFAPTLAQIVCTVTPDLRSNVESDRFFRDPDRVNEHFRKVGRSTSQIVYRDRRIPFHHSQNLQSPFQKPAPPIHGRSCYRPCPEQGSLEMNRCSTCSSSSSESEADYYNICRPDARIRDARL